MDRPPQILASKEQDMSAQKDYWTECIAIAAEECGLKLTTEQLEYLASAAEGGHEHYGMAFYSPPASDRLEDIEREWKEKLRRLQAEFDAYRGNAETAVKQALRVYDDANVSIEPHGEVLMHGGRTVRIQ
jgi:molecular chaperone GrpE (heat shock protein)